MKEIYAVDLFAGAGGASTGALRACHALGLKPTLLAVNHWPTAIATHSLNYPDVHHLCESVEKVNPLDAVPGGRLQLLIAAPECTHHSNARGGRPVKDQQRAQPWMILKWLQELYVENLLIENVPELQQWGPIGADGQPLPSKAGQTYRAFLEAIRSLNYKVEDKVLCAADYGDPTTRRRLFIIAKRGRGRIYWPEPTHSRTGHRTLFGPTQKWRGAREIIDWDLPSESIFTRKRPLSPNTMRRILVGLERFGGAELKPFLIVLRNNMGARDLDLPAPTVSAGGQHLGLVEPFVLQQQSGGVARKTDEPLPTIACDGAIALVEPFLVPPRGFAKPGPIDSVDDPLRTIVSASGHTFAVVEPFLLPHFGERPGQTPRTHDIDAPVPTIAATGRIDVVQPFVCSAGGPEVGPRSTEDPLNTVLTRDHMAVVQPFVASYYGTDNLSPVSDPLPTVTSKDRFALVMPVVNGRALDIRLRMLQPKELAAAHSFSADYKFTGNQGEQVKQIGNSIPTRLVQALVEAMLQDYAATRPTARAPSRKDRMSDKTPDEPPHLTDEELLDIQAKARERACDAFTAIVQHHRPRGHCPECVLANASLGMLTSIAVVLDALALDNEQRRVEWVEYLREMLDAARASRDPRVTLRAAVNQPAVPGVH